MFRTTLELSPEFATQYRSVEDRLPPALKAKLHPYRVDVAINGNFLELTGDEPAVIIVQTLIQAVADEWMSGSAPSDVWSEDRINAGFDDVLKRELAFRLAGCARRCVR